MGETFFEWMHIRNYGNTPVVEFEWLTFTKKPLLFYPKLGPDLAKKFRFKSIPIQQAFEHTCKSH